MLFIVPSSLASSSREKLGESSAIGPSKTPAAAISSATLPPKLCPATMSAPTSAASFPASAA
jgi:hypothetical protein